MSPANGPSPHANSNGVKSLTQSQIDHFLEHGWIKLTNCFTREQAAEVTANLEARLDITVSDKSTWHTERIHCPWHREFPLESFSPKAFGAICDLLRNGADDARPPGAYISPEHLHWRDSLIVNLGTPSGAGRVVDPWDLTNWHVDGDFFVHYLDSPEQALLVVPLFSDIPPLGGGTVICPPGIRRVATHLRDNPEGVSPRFTPRSENPGFREEDTLAFFCDAARRCADESEREGKGRHAAFVEVMGEVGDVYLLHPLMPHSASNNTARALRVITNPPVSLLEPFQFDREDGNYSVVERKTLRELGVPEGEGLTGWKIQAERQRVVPKRERIQAEMKVEEERRIREKEEAEKAEPRVSVGTVAAASA